MNLNAGLQCGLGSRANFGLVAGMGLAHQSGDAGGHFGRSVGKRAWCAGRGGFVSGHAGRNRPFPGDWEPLRGRNVRIISVQKIQENEANSGAQAKLEFAKSLLDKNYADLAAKSQELSGVVLIFDSSMAA